MRQILTDIAAVIDANDDYSASVPAGESFIQITGPAGSDFAISGVAPADVNWAFRTTTEVKNAVASLQAASDSDDDWYFLIDTTHSNKQAEAIARYIETKKEIIFLSNK